MKRKKKKRIEKKSPLLAAVFNSIFWGMGYFYLEKKTNKGIIVFILNILTWLFSFWYAAYAGNLVFVGIFWITLWYVWISMFLSYDAYKTARRKK